MFTGDPLSASTPTINHSPASIISRRIFILHSEHRSHKAIGKTMQPSLSHLTLFLLFLIAGGTLARDIGGASSRVAVGDRKFASPETSTEPYGQTGSPSGATGSGHGSNWDFNWGWGSTPTSGWGYGSGSGRSPNGFGKGFGYGSGSGSGASGSGYGYGSGSGGAQGGGFGSGSGSGSSAGGGGGGGSGGSSGSGTHSPSDSGQKTNHG
ncbi:hypothetical protein OIU85_013465 [Salix viminalis]|uniref:Glycine-rich cell wall structural protein 1 n=1 Tax=Salix viminalis TaxID=40686 RepID=A0A6N2MLX2_SALVM|nr:hypothetical protein OIU85_013465 [Salix viminalis]